jgi:hypothetical protein
MTKKGFGRSEERFDSPLVMNVQKPDGGNFLIHQFVKDDSV